MPDTSTTSQLNELVADFKQASQKLVLLDYDGVLSPLKDDISPDASKPSAETKALLEKIADKPNTSLYVVSGRTKDALEGWFGDHPSIGLSAEHGAWRKEQGIWRKKIDEFDKLKEQVITALKPFTERVKGSHIETKEFSVVWHFRTAEDERVVAEAIPDIEKVLSEITTGTDLGVHVSAETGKIIEVKPKSISKGGVTTALVSEHDSPDFLMAMGDDYTDEHMFEACPSGSWTIKVGGGETSAKLRLSNVGDVFSLLNQLSQT